MHSDALRQRSTSASGAKRTLIKLRCPAGAEETPGGEARAAGGQRGDGLPGTPQTHNAPGNGRGFFTTRSLTGLTAPPPELKRRGETPAVRLRRPGVERTLRRRRLRLERRRRPARRAAQHPAWRSTSSGRPTLLAARSTVGHDPACPPSKEEQQAARLLGSLALEAALRNCRRILRQSERRGCRGRKQGSVG
jgi:hypothetical protein